MSKSNDNDFNNERETVSEKYKKRDAEKLKERKSNKHKNKKYVNDYDTDY